MMARDLKILIVDDFSTMRKILRSFLTKMEFHNITEAEDAKQAWELLQKEDFDLVMSDYNMPEMTGIELLTKIRTEYRNKDQKFIMLTAETEKEILIKAKSLNITEYILKPFKMEIIKDKIFHAFGLM